ncbi:hypothetical protein VSDG_08216 [Cytospora chrysosperma]|uniref:Uncharacterized protein n=1 Tax=Cytospora chrysosperma TaxID=252740 RepID=A0A423VFZ1_CYTCH|nr:hypothetical protein VSDG_08216 [Valsa sordida]
MSAVAWSPTGEPILVDLSPAPCDPDWDLICSAWAPEEKKEEEKKKGIEEELGYVAPEPDEEWEDEKDEERKAAVSTMCDFLQPVWN